MRDRDNLRRCDSSGRFVSDDAACLLRCSPHSRRCTPRKRSPVSALRRLHPSVMGFCVRYVGLKMEARPWPSARPSSVFGRRHGIALFTRDINKLAVAYLHRHLDPQLDRSLAWTSVCCNCWSRDSPPATARSSNRCTSEPHSCRGGCYLCCASKRSHSSDVAATTEGT
jgi:hypothetical protein